MFLRGRRLFQQFLVTSYIDIQKKFLNWCRYNQKTLKADNYTGLKEYLQQRADNHNKQIGKMVELHRARASTVSSKVILEIMLVG